MCTHKTNQAAQPHKPIPMQEPLQRHQGYVQARMHTDQQLRTQKIHLQPLPQRIRFGRAFRKACGVMFEQRLPKARVPETRQYYKV